MKYDLNTCRDFYQGKRVLVTGHTGFKGSWLCRILTLAGAQVTGYAAEAPTDPALFSIAGLADTMDSVIGDIRDLGHLKEVFDRVQPEIVLHLAAQPIVRDSYKDPVYTYETNVMGTVNVLECVRLTPSVKSFLNVTTDKVYENREWEYGYRECDPLDGYDPYSNSKSCSELVTHSYQKSFFADGHCAISTARAGNVIGGGPDHPGLCAGHGGRQGDRGAQSLFYPSVPACAGAAVCLSGDCPEAVRGSGIPGLLQRGPG